MLHRELAAEGFERCYSSLGRFRAVFCEQTSLGHLAAAIHPILEGLGGTARSWRVDRMATAVIPGTTR